MKYKLIVTHPGVFHADELVAIATLARAEDRKVLEISESELSVERDDSWIPVLRTNKIEEAWLDDPEILIFDIGGIYNPALGNFDHHQNSLLSATNVLVLDWFYGQNPKLVEVLRKNFYDAISDIDRGITKSGPGSFSSVITSFNMLPEHRRQESSVIFDVSKFQKALNVVAGCLEGIFITALESIRLEDKYLALPKTGLIRIQSDTEFIPNWKELAEKEGTLLLVQPNLRGGWQIVSRDSDEITIPQDPRQTFRHNSGFMAVYQTKEDAISHAIQICQK